ncbi:MAG: hypothetical protein DWH80_00255 [Planctomycetota bacterium]|nr:MAG: hypothetical protein DWH80_00255 [Planctomycetota bacterium]
MGHNESNQQHPVTIRCRVDGPLVVEGSVRVTDHRGCEFSINTEKKPVALCRCGLSGSRPFCDGSHKASGFMASEEATNGIAPSKQISASSSKKENLDHPGHHSVNKIVQRSLEVAAMTSGFHPITRLIEKALPEIESIEIGMLHVFLQHTSAGLLITENADPDVLVDLSCAMNALAPEGDHWIHSCEGPDDMPAHVKSVLEGPSVSVPVGNGKLLLGTWQGIFLAEHRRHASSRRLILSLSGSTRASLAPFTRQEAST